MTIISTLILSISVLIIVFRSTHNIRKVCACLGIEFETLPQFYQLFKGLERINNTIIRRNNQIDGGDKIPNAINSRANSETKLTCTLVTTARTKSKLDLFRAQTDVESIGLNVICTQSVQEVSERSQFVSGDIDAPGF